MMERIAETSPRFEARRPVQRGIGDSRVPSTLDSMLRERKRLCAQQSWWNGLQVFFYLLTANF